jgi:hypothetical protein
MYPKTLAEVPAAIRARVTVERRIVKKTVDALLAAGYALATDQGDHRFYGDSNPTRDRQTILDALCEVDEEHLGVFTADEATGVERVVQPFGWVYFVYGNDGPDVVSDYTTNLETVLAPVNDYAAALDDAQTGGA